MRLSSEASDQIGKDGTEIMARGHSLDLRCSPDLIATAVMVGADLALSRIKIESRCPACGNHTLLLDDSGHLVCSWLQCSNPSVDAAIDELKLAREELGRTKAKCLDCGLPYSEFGLDVILPRPQWLEIHPEDNGLLCARCIVLRAAKVPRCTTVHAILEIQPPSKAVPGEVRE